MSNDDPTEVKSGGGKGDKGPRTEWDPKKIQIWSHGRPMGFSFNHNKRSKSSALGKEVDMVMRGSTAEKSGILVGDVLTQIANQDCRKLSVEQIAKILTYEAARPSGCTVWILRARTVSDAKERAQTIPATLEEVTLTVVKVPRQRLGIVFEKTSYGPAIVTDLPDPSLSGPMAGLKVGDRLMQIEGMDVSSADNLELISELLRVAAPKFTIVVHRNKTNTRAHTSGGAEELAGGVGDGEAFSTVNATVAATCLAVPANPKPAEVSLAAPGQLPARRRWMTNTRLRVSLQRALRWPLPCNLLSLRAGATGARLSRRVDSQKGKGKKKGRFDVVSSKSSVSWNFMGLLSSPEPSAKTSETPAPPAALFPKARDLKVVRPGFDQLLGTFLVLPDTPHKGAESARAWAQRARSEAIEAVLAAEAQSDAARRSGILVVVPEGHPTVATDRSLEFLRGAFASSKVNVQAILLPDSKFRTDKAASFEISAKSGANGDKPEMAWDLPPVVLVQAAAFERVSRVHETLQDAGSSLAPLYLALRVTATVNTTVLDLPTPPEDGAAEGNKDTAKGPETGEVETFRWTYKNPVSVNQTAKTRPPLHFATAFAGGGLKLKFGRPGKVTHDRTKTPAVDVAMEVTLLDLMEPKPMVVSLPCMLVRMAPFLKRALFRVLPRWSSSVKSFVRRARAAGASRTTCGTAPFARERRRMVL